MSHHRTVRIDCRELKTALRVHESLAAQLNFPTWYGKNLDALADSLSDALLESTITIEWKDTLASKVNRSLRRIKKILREQCTVVQV